MYIILSMNITNLYAGIENFIIKSILQILAYQVKYTVQDALAKGYNSYGGTFDRHSEIIIKQL